jgi:hypothetical protein
MKARLKTILKSFSAEVPVYAVLVAIYFFLVLRFLGERLYNLFRSERQLYAIVSLVLIIGQGYGLELLTRALLGLAKRKGKK